MVCSIYVSPKVLAHMDIPSRITDAQLTDSGYTYRFANYKKHIAKSLEAEVEDVTFTIKHEQMGVRITGVV